MIATSGRDWRAILLLVGGGGSGVVALGGAFSLAAYAALDAMRSREATSPAAQIGIFVGLGTLIVIGSILSIAAYHALQLVRGRPAASIAMAPLRIPAALVLGLTWLAASLLAQAVVQGGPTWLASPLHVAAIACPIYLAARLATAGLPSRSVTRAWGSLAAGMVGSTGISALAEIAVLSAGLLAAAFFIIMNPERVFALEGLARALSHAQTVEDTLDSLRPLLLRPETLVAVLLAVSVVTPIIEEVAKTVGPWLLYGRMLVPAEGFWCGALSGAGFALFEGLMASADASGNWTVIFLIRAWGSMMHILASGIAGWGIAVFRTTRKSSRLVAGYATSIGIHALWNTSVVGIGYGGLRFAIGGAAIDRIGMAAIAAGGVTLLTLCLMLPLAIVLINRRLRATGSVA